MEPPKRHWQFVPKPHYMQKSSRWLSAVGSAVGGCAALAKATRSPTDTALAQDSRVTPRQQHSAGECGEMMTLQLEPPHGAKRFECVNKCKALDKALGLSSKLRCMM